MRGSWRAYLDVMRPDHWLKNIFILFGLAAALVLTDVPLDLRTGLLSLLSLVPACLIASANYILNEILDAPYDRMHPTKCRRPVAAGIVSERILWGLMALLILLGFGVAALVFNRSYSIALALLLLSGILYNVKPIRLKDVAFADFILESFNNPIRLWLGWYALTAANSFPPLSIVVAWWSFGALLMSGKRYAELRFIDDADRSGAYRKSFRIYTEQSLLLSMFASASVFYFCAGVAVAVYKQNLIFVFPFLLIAIMAYFHAAMNSRTARLEPEQLMKNPWIILTTLAIAALSAFLVFAPDRLTEPLHFFQLIDGK